MRILVTRTTRAAPDGVTVATYRAGHEAELPEELARVFVRQGWGRAAETAPAGKAPEAAPASKPLDGSPASKTSPQAPRTRRRRRRGRGRRAGRPGNGAH